MNSATSSRPQEVLLKSKRSAIPQDRNSEIIRLCLRSEDAITVEEILFDDEGKIALFFAKTYKVEGIEFTCKIQIPISFLVETSEGPNLLSKSIVALSWQGLIQHWNVPRQRTANKKPLELAVVLLLHVRSRDLEVHIRFGRCKRAHSVHTCGNLLHKSLRA